MGESFFGGNQHNDVLQAKPEDDAARERLVEELKRRGNVAFKAGSLPEADTLYSKAIEHNDKVAALFGNRSMTRAGMGKFKDALEDADKAVEVDPAWVKGHYRRAMAYFGLEQLDKAEAALNKVLAMDPDNKAAKAELAKLPERRAKVAELRAIEAKRKAEKAEQEAEAASRVISRKVVDGGAPVKAATAAPAAATKKKAKGEPDLSMRGYRTLADGRKTTFFNRELSEEEKELLKDNKPKQVAEELSELQLKEQQLKQDGASAWNQGGTFEEKSHSEWARARIKELLVGLSTPVQLADKDGDKLAHDLKVTELADLEGDASIAFTRGKKRHIFDFNFNAKWNLSLDGTEVTGSLFFPDVSGDSVVDGDEVEAELRWSNRDKAGSAANQAAIKDALVSRAADGLLGKLDKAIHAFAQEFRSRS